MEDKDIVTEQTITLPVTGMTCANCAANIERGLKKLEGVQTTNVNFAAEQAVVAFDPKQLHVKDVVKNIQGSGYTVTTATTEFPALFRRPLTVPRNEFPWNIFRVFPASKISYRPLKRPVTAP
jgi:copper chaperone CopZ